jgi:hypothetical protein
MTHPTFIIDKQFMLHEGGTKFYQVIRACIKDPGSMIFGTGGRAMTVTHWGPLKGEPGLRRVIDGGQSKIEHGDKYASAQSAKRKRGYGVDSVSWGITARIESTDQLQSVLTAEFGATDAFTILGGLGVVSAAVGTVDDDPYDLRGDKFWGRTPPVDDTPAAASTEGWGDF